MVSTYPKRTCHVKLTVYLKGISVRAVAKGFSEHIPFFSRGNASHAMQLIEDRLEAREDVAV